MSLAEVGDEDFSMMDKLDADEEPLWSRMTPCRRRVLERCTMAQIDAGSVRFYPQWCSRHFLPIYRLRMTLLKLSRD